MNTARVLIAHDREAVCRAIQSSLQLVPEWQLGTAVASNSEWAAAIESVRPEIVIVAESLFRAAGSGTVNEVLERHPEIDLLVLSDSESDSLTNGRDLLAVERLAGSVLGILQRKYRALPGDVPSRRGLSGRERQIVALLVQGKSQKQVAEMLGISVKTVETHRSHIFCKLRLHNLEELCRYVKGEY